MLVIATVALGPPKYEWELISLQQLTQLRRIWGPHSENWVRRNMNAFSQQDATAGSCGD